jgi:hypothetical protein
MTLWFVRVPLKINIFMWLTTTHGSILTKDILLHRGWKGKDASCIFCDCNETIDHLFFGCAVARVVFLVLYSQKKKMFLVLSLELVLGF